MTGFSKAMLTFNDELVAKWGSLSFVLANLSIVGTAGVSFAGRWLAGSSLNPFLLIALV